MKFFADNSGMRVVTQDAWAEHVSEFMTYQTESVFGQYSIMYSKLSPRGGYAKPDYVIGEVHYSPDGNKAYFIR